MDESTIQATDIAFSYGDRRALNGVSFAVQKGAVHGFLGPNGSGKSTLFKVLATILPVQEGSVQVFGLDLHQQKAELRQRLGVVFQSPALDKKLSVRANLVYGGHLYGFFGGELNRRVDEMLGHAGLQDRAKDKVGDLSGGLRRRVELAKGLLHSPQVVLLDEPSTGLDPGARQDLWRFLRSREEVTVLFTSHLMDEADEADAITLLSEGSIVAEGTPDELKCAIGGEVLEVESTEPEALAVDLRTKLDVEPLVLGNSLRIQREDAHGLVTLIMSEFGARVSKITLSHPSLEDVFIEKTGHRFWGEEEAGA